MKDKTADIRELLTAASIAAYREQVIEECVRIATDWCMKENIPGWGLIEAIRALKERPNV